LTTEKVIVAIHQPQYLPWLGYFDKIDKADKFIFLDTVQFKKNEWQNRNRIKTAQGWQWLTVPTLYKFPERINEVKVNNSVRWQHIQRQSIVSNYSPAPYFKEFITIIEDIFSEKWDFLSPLNILSTKKLVEILGIKTDIFIASELGVFPEDPDDRLISIVKSMKGTHYLAGSGGKNYMNIDKYSAERVEVIFQEFHCPQYIQLFHGFQSNMSVIDLLFNHGEQSLPIIRGKL
jgi:hypothetical protein